MHWLFASEKKRFMNKRDRLFGELEVKKIQVSNSEKKFSLLRGLKSDRCFSEEATGIV